MVPPSSPSPFAKERLSIEGELVLESPLHVGDGRAESDERLQIEGSDELSELSSIVLDGSGKPYIPGSSIKGALAALCNNLDDRNHIFGKVPVAGSDAGIMGKLIIYGARLKSAAPESHFPYFDRKTSMQIAARTKINGSTGTAMDAMLFHESEIAAGTVFEFRAMWLDAASTVPQLLKDLFARLETGFCMGAGTAAGRGRLKLQKLNLKKMRLAKNGDWLQEGVKPETLRGLGSALTLNQQTLRLELTCDGPYLVNDGLWKHPVGNKILPHLKPLGAPEDADKRSTAVKHALPGSSLKGVLRSLSSWLEGGKSTVLTDELFGTFAHAGRVQITNVQPMGIARLTRLDSVRLDRYSSGPIEGALFSTLCFVDPKFIVDISCAHASPRAVAHFDLLIEKIKKRGLRLGHGTNRGFGWFKVVEAAA